MTKLLLPGLLLFALALVGCSDIPNEPVAESTSIPSNFPPVPIPKDNAITEAKVKLGHYLFYDARLSRDSTIACASCHNPQTGFTDSPRLSSKGFRDQVGFRNAPTIINAAYNAHQFWDGRAGSLEEQGMGAFTNLIEMAADTNAVNDYLKRDYADLWYDAFGDSIYSCVRAMQAISTWERTLIVGNSRYDQYVRGNKAALTAQEQQGMQLFFSDRTMCASCHSGVNFTDGQFYNLGLFNHYLDRGRYEVTKNGKDESKFKTPGLRNVALTPPYMSTGDSKEGILTTLELVVKHYNDGGTAFPTKDKRIKKLHLTDDEQASLVAFMKTLTDTSYLHDARFMPISR